MAAVSSRVGAGVSRWQELSFYLVVIAQVLSIVNGLSPLPCGGVKGRYICDDEDPQVFHICMGNNKYTHKCPGDLHYNVRTQNCDWPKSVNCVEEARQRALQKRLDVAPDAPSKIHDTAKKPQAKAQEKYSPVPDKQVGPRSTSRPQDKSPLPSQVNQAVRHKDSNEYSGKFDRKGEQFSETSREVTRKPEVSTRSFTYQVESESGSIDYTDEPDFSEENRIQRIRSSDRIVQPYKATAAPKTSTTTRKITTIKTTPTSTTTKPTTTRPLTRSPTTVSRSPFKKPTVAYHPVQNTRIRTEQREFAPQNPVESIKPKTTRKPKNDDRWDPYIESAPYKSATNFDDDITSVPKWYETTGDDSANRLDDSKMSTRAYSKQRQEVYKEKPAKKTEDNAEVYKEKPAKKTEDNAEKELVPSWVKSNQVKSQVAKSIPISVAHSHNVMQQKVQTTKDTPTQTTTATFQRARTTLKKFKPRPTEIEDVARTFTTVKTALKEKFSLKKEGKLWYEEETAKVESTSRPEVKEQKDETVQNIVFSRRPVTNSRFSRKTEPHVTSSRPDYKETTKDAVTVTKEKITQRPSYSAAASTVSKSPFAPFNRQVVGRTSQKPSDETFSQKSTRVMSSQRPIDDKSNQRSIDEKSNPRLNEENPRQKSNDESSPQRRNDDKSYLVSAEDKSSPASREVDSEKSGKSLPWWSKDQVRTNSHSGHADQPKGASSRRAYIPVNHNTQKPNYHTRTPKFDIELVPSNQGGADDETSARRFTPRHKVQDTSKEVDRSFSLHQVDEAASADRRFALHKAYNPPNQAAAAEDRKFALHKAQNSATNPYSAAAAVDKRPETQQQQASPSRVNAPAALDKFSVGLIKEDPKHVNREVKEQSQYKSPIEKYDYKKGKCSSTWCKLPDCRCIGSDVPGDLDPKDIPQLVMLTFDDSINGQNMGYYKTIFNGTLKNPNGCPIKSTFFVSGDNSDYEMVRKIHKGGHEIASHTLSHRSPTTWWADAGFENWEQEVVGMKKRLHEKSGIPLDNIVGMRAPFLQVGGDAQYAMLKENRFRYDTSMVTGNLYVNNEAPTWPFTLDTPPDSKTCSLTPCPTRSYPGLWEVPLIRWYGNNRIACAMPDACTIGAGTKGSRKFIEDNFMRHYTTNRAPFGIFIHASWFARKDGNLEGLVEFLGSLADKDDVWVVTVNQALDWIQRPVRLSAISAMDSWMC